MSDADKRFHEQWLGMAQPSEGLVVSVAVLVSAQCAEKQSRAAHDAFLACLVEDPEARLRVESLATLCSTVLELGPERFDEGEALPQELSLYVVEGKQRLTPTRALRWVKPPEKTAGADATPAAEAGRPYAMLVWEVSPEVSSLDKPETVTGSWDYPAQAKFERLLRECRVPIGLLSNGYEMRLVYAPHGESSGWLAFRVADLASVSGRPLFDAFVMLLSRERWFGVAPEQQLPAILAESRRRNADVTNELSHQVFEALEILLAGFAAADERDPTSGLRAAIERGDDHLYAGLLTLLLRLVFLLYCEDQGLLPTEHPLYAEGYSILGLFDALQADHGRYPDTMHRRFGAYPRLVALFRAVFLGVSHRGLEIPARRGELFDPNVYPFLEGWGPEGSAPITQPEERGQVMLPSVDDRTIFAALEKLLYLDGQRLSYKALDVEQIGSVYEALMGFAVSRVEGTAIRIRLGSKKGAARVWVEVPRLLAVAKAQRASHLEDELGFDKATAKKIVDALGAAKTESDAATALEPLSGRRAERVSAGTLVIQPGPERRRTSSHYTPRELTEPIVARTLEPLLRAMGEAPAAETLLNLVVCDPAMGSGAFLVAACRYLADHLVAAWTREGKLELVASAHDDVVNYARRLVAQRCLYGVDKNRYAVHLARLSLWLVTMARNEPFTFVDHALRHGDSLVGLSFDQIRAFHWEPSAQVELTTVLLQEALDEAIGIRRQILDLASEGTMGAQREKELLLFDAEDALGRVRLIGDLVIGAFFGQAKDKDREAERKRRLGIVERWLAAEKRGDGEKASKLEEELRAIQAELLATQVPFHWMVEFPEVFWVERPDPLDGNRVNGAAFVDAFVGNPPFLGGHRIPVDFGEAYRDWLFQTDEVGGKCDLSALFFRRAADLLGAHGCICLIATNTIAQGDTRLSGLKPLLGNGFRIFDAKTNWAWPGDAAVTVSVVSLALGTVLQSVRPAILNGAAVEAIDSRLAPGLERADAVPLSSNSEYSFKGCEIGGQGFLVTQEEHAALTARDPRNQERIFLYLGGEDVNTHPEQLSNRLVIDFAQMTEEEARRWPELYDLVSERVRADRERSRRSGRAQRWWQFAEAQPAMRAAIQPLTRCLVTARVTKHLCFSFQPTNRVLNEKLYIFPLTNFTAFTVLQSRLHVAWTWLVSSTMKTDLNYSGSDCFETFPFPKPDPGTVLAELEAIGEKLYDTRARFMVDTNQGLTKTYNALKDPASTDSRVLELRLLHEDMDRAVLAAYGWSDLPVPPYCPTTDAERAALKAFEDAVIDRLFALNAERAEEERRAVPEVQGKGKKKAGKRGKKGDPEGGPLLPGMG